MPCRAGTSCAPCSRGGLSHSKHIPWEMENSMALARRKGTTSPRTCAPDTFTGRQGMSCAPPAPAPLPSLQLPPTHPSAHCHHHSTPWGPKLPWGCAQGKHQQTQEQTHVGTHLCRLSLPLRARSPPCSPSSSSTSRDASPAALGRFGLTMQHSLASSCAPSPALTHVANPLELGCCPSAFCRLCPHNSAHLSGEGRGQQVTPSCASHTPE